jgi:hypothetical protein
MIWITIAVFCAAGAGMILGRHAFARMQAMLLGGKVVPGCVIAEAVAFFVLSAVVFMFREMLR